MSKISAFKVEIPCDDLVRSEAVKAILLDAIRALGAKVMAAEAVKGEIFAPAELTAFFSAASVKTFIIQPTKAARITARGAKS